jgi:hypothetical protein
MAKVKYFLKLALATALALFVLNLLIGLIEQYATGLNSIRKWVYTPWLALQELRGGGGGN